MSSKQNYGIYLIMNSEDDKDVNSNEELVYALLVDDDEVVVDTFQERRQKQFIMQSRSKKQWITIVALGVVGIFILSIGLLESPFFRVQKIHISIHNQETIDKIERSKINEITRRAKGQPMYRNSFKEIESEIQDMVSVASVDLSKSWPKTLNVKIVRRKAVAYIQTDQGIALVDSAGFVFQKSEEALVGYPSFEGLDEIEFAKTISDPTFIEVLNRAPSEIKGQIVIVRLDNKKYSLELTDGIDIILGDSSNLKEKLAISWSILQAKKRSELGYIDVSVPSLPVSGSPQLKV